MRLSKRCYAVTGLYYLEPWSVNAGFIVGEGKTLVVDTGASLLSARTIHGYATAVREGNGLIVINTEAHLDHIGGNAFFLERGAPAYGCPGMMRTQAEFETGLREENEYLRNNARRDNRETFVPFEGTRIENANKAIEEDTKLDLGGVEARVLLTPGHTITNLSVWIEEDRVLYCGDCLLRGIVPNLEAGTARDWKTWLRSLDRIVELDVETILPGHGSPIMGRAEVLREIARVRRVLETAIEKGIAPTLA